MDLNSNEKDKNLSYTEEEFYQYVKLIEQGDNPNYLHKMLSQVHDSKNKNQNDETITSTLASFMRSDDDTVVKAEAMKEIIEKVLKEVRQEEVYVLSNVNNETKTFIVKKINLPKGSYKLGICKMQYDYLKKISALIGYNIMIIDFDKEKSYNMEEQSKISPEIITSINPQCSLSQSFLTNPSKVAEFNKNLDKTLEENALKLYRGKKNADKMKPII